MEKNVKFLWKKSEIIKNVSNLRGSPEVSRIREKLDQSAHSTEATRVREEARELAELGIKLDMNLTVWSSKLALRIR